MKCLKQPVSHTYLILFRFMAVCSLNFFYCFPRYTPQSFLRFSAHILFLRKFNKLSRLISIDWKCLMDHIVTTRLLSVGYHQRLDFAENFAINRVSVTNEV